MYACLLVMSWSDSNFDSEVLILKLSTMSDEDQARLELLPILTPKQDLSYQLSPTLESWFAEYGFLLVSKYMIGLSRRQLSRGVPDFALPFE